MEATQPQVNCGQTNCWVTRPVEIQICRGVTGATHTLQAGMQPPSSAAAIISPCFLLLLLPILSPRRLLSSSSSSSCEVLCGTRRFLAALTQLLLSQAWIHTAAWVL